MGRRASLVSPAIGILWRQRMTDRGDKWMPCAARTAALKTEPELHRGGVLCCELRALFHSGFLRGGNPLG